MKKRLKIRLSENDIIFEDDNYIALNKKAGWPVHKTLDPMRDNCTDALKSYLKFREDGKSPYLVLVHRLDVETAGILLFAKSKEANKYLQDLFSSHQADKIDKRYLAICSGRPKTDEGTIENFIKGQREGRKEKMVVVSSGGKKAITNYWVKDFKNDYSLIEFQILTGRKHQIRLHAKSIGHPIFGDPIYSNSKEQDGQRLCAYKLSFFDKFSNQKIDLEIRPVFDLDNFRTKISDEFKYIIFNKPYNVLCQFGKDHKDQLSLIDYNLPKELYPVGRLDKDSEGLLILTNDGKYKDRMANAKSKVEKTYLVQVDGDITNEAIEELKKGVVIKDNYKTKPAKVKKIESNLVKVEQRDPPVRFRKNIPTSWIEVRISEGKNRQVRRMCAAVGFPTLRLIRTAIGNIKLGELKLGQFEFFDGQ
ncbi:pseudouridine synthase [Halobacteriovorax vibrionivorans]|uniref:Pseudouridine synthase n=1 Tax=Halobacteriovorax vibrionivorans TaxID=2152716 RepID=A0ABY0II28_9BACT|nr:MULTISPECIES: pseudouridine synthase [Halobacteriovorax]RZF21204.1 pseudouridine synthase [Halobacteriovorax vibrionivorans]TGD46836.1 pseudouridine synthase [Halobacteriovorax sp. Y22]